MLYYPFARSSSSSSVLNIELVSSLGTAEGIRDVKLAPVSAADLNHLRSAERV